MRVTLPQNLKCVMAENYIESIDNGMILRLPEEEKSVKVILEKYREYAEKSVPEGRSIYWYDQVPLGDAPVSFRKHCRCAYCLMEGR